MLQCLEHNATLINCVQNMQGFTFTAR